MKQKIYTITYASEVDGDLYTETKVTTGMAEAGQILNEYIYDIAESFDEDKPEPEDYHGGVCGSQWTSPNLHTYRVDVTEQEIYV